MKNSKDIFNKLNALNLRAPEDLKGLVLSRYQKNTSIRKKLRRYHVLVIVLFVINLVTVQSLFKKDETAIIAKTDNIMTLKLHSNHELKGLYKAEVHLPKGVYFFSEKFPEIAQLTSLKLYMNDIDANESISIPLVGVNPGLKKVSVNYFDSGNNLLESRSLVIDFDWGYNYEGASIIDCFSAYYESSL